MKDNQNNLYGFLEQIPTQKLDAMLLEELQKEQVGGDAVRVILRVLREREEDMPVVIDDAAEQAWQKYLDDTSVSQKPARKRRWILRAAAMAAVLCVILLVGPMTANAESFYDMLVRWTDSVMEFLSPSSFQPNVTAYEFKTDNAGLQEVYEAVVGLGITDPLVPMWLPEGFEILECEISETSRVSGIAAIFSDGTNYFVFQVDLFTSGSSHAYHKDGVSAVTREINGVTHTILQNEGRWAVVWAAENVECFIGAECQEDVLYKILESIYGMEDD